jgi:hypothetical protein
VGTTRIPGRPGIRGFCRESSRCTAAGPPSTTACIALSKRADSAWSSFKLTRSARSAKVGSTDAKLRVAPTPQAIGSPNSRTPFSQQTERSHWSPSSSRLNPWSWLS